MQSGDDYTFTKLRHHAPSLCTWVRCNLPEASIEFEYSVQHRWWQAVIRYLTAKGKQPEIKHTMMACSVVRHMRPDVALWHAYLHAHAVHKGYSVPTQTMLIEGREWLLGRDIVEGNYVIIASPPVADYMLYVRDDKVDLKTLKEKAFRLAKLMATIHPEGYDLTDQEHAAGKAWVLSYEACKHANITLKSGETITFNQPMSHL